MRTDKVSSQGQLVLQLLTIAVLGMAVTAYAATTGSLVLTVGDAGIFLAMFVLALVRGRRTK